MKTKTLDFTLLFVRAALGLVILAHGVQKLLGWFGGYGFDATMGYFTGVVGLPAVFAFLIIIAESLGMIALVFGLLSRVVSGALIVIMAGAIASHAQYGFFMNWFGAQAGEGIEYHILVIVLSVVILVLGAGAYSLDRIIANKWFARNIQEARA